MPTSVDRVEAKRILHEAYAKKAVLHDTVFDNIAAILKGPHKTYRYILITGLLAKATNADADPIALQAGADLYGAYDARSLCHNVVVPFEREFLSKALGGSNEPFLNKPARFTKLSIDNAVRRGSDRETLVKVLSILSGLQSSTDAFNRLAGALKVLIEVAEEKKLSQVDYHINLDLQKILDFIMVFTQDSLEGESCVLVTAAIEKMYYAYQGKDFTVVPHKTNQSGASSKEIGDIDVFDGVGSYFYSIEVKDKNFSEYDVSHAFDKMFAAGSDRGVFVYGQHADFDEEEIRKVVHEYSKKGFLILFCNIITYSKFVLFKLPSESYAMFLGLLRDVASQINSSDAAIERINTCTTEIKD